MKYSEPAASWSGMLSNQLPFPGKACTSIWCSWPPGTRFDRIPLHAAPVTVPSARHAGLLPVLRRVGKLSEAQARASSHVTRGKDETTRRALFHALGEAPCCSAALRRLETRLRLATGGGVRPAASSADNGAMDAERPRCIWHRSAGGRSGGGWWSSAELTRVIVGTTAPGLLPGHGSNVHRRTVHNATPLTPQSCCERCRAAVDPGCLYFNYASGNARPLARCTLLSSRMAFFPSRRVLTGAA